MFSKIKSLFVKDVESITATFSKLVDQLEKHAVSKDSGSEAQRERARYLEEVAAVNAKHAEKAREIAGKVRDLIS